MKQRAALTVSRGLIVCLSVLGLASLLPHAALVVSVMGLLPQEAAAAMAALPRFLRLLGNSLSVSGLSVVISLGLGCPVGFLVFRSDLPGRRLLVLATAVSLCIPVYIHAAAWLALCGMPLLSNSTLAASWVQGLAYTPLALLLTGVAFARASRQREDLAHLDAGPAGVIRHVTLHEGAWAVAAAGVCVALLTLSDITVTDILMVRTFAEETFSQFQLGAGPARAALTAVPLMPVLAGLALAVLYLLRRYTPAAESRELQRPRRFRLGAARWPLAAAAWLAAALFCIFPVVSLLRAVATPANLIRAWHDVLPELLYTLAVTPAAATLTTAAALPAAWALCRRPGVRPPVIAAILFLLVFPASLSGIGIALLLNRPGLLGKFYDSPGVLVYAYLVRSLPFAVIAAVAAMRHVPRQLEDAAAIDGLPWLQRLWHVVLPLSWRGIILVWCVSFVLAIGELGASVLVAPPGVTTLKIRFQTLVHYGVYPSVAGLCLILLFGAIAPGCIVVGILWRQLRRQFD